MRIGFTDGIKIEKILSVYEKRFGEIEISSSCNVIRNRRGQIHKYVESSIRKLSYQKCISILKFEIDFRFNSKDFQLKKHLNHLVSATEISTFVFCKASYSISKTFVIEESINKFSKYYGTQLHEKLKLIRKKSYFGFKNEFQDNFSSFQRKFLNKISRCEVIFTGHSNIKGIFKNLEKGYVGQPDYIFKDPNGKYFVVEEKFHLRHSTEKISETSVTRNEDFFESNIVQLQSYIQYIKEYDLKYGVLVNWYYMIKNDEFVIDDLTFRIIRKNDNTELLDQSFEQIKSFKQTGEIEFYNDVNINKCLNCSVSLYCGHKTDEYNTLKFPYDLDSVKLKYFSYPF